MQVVGITGRSGSGKSALTQYYASLGYPTMDGDAVSREIMAPGSPVVRELAAAFGKGILFADGSLDRRRLGELAFADPAGNERLVGITHPYILAEFLRRAEAAQAGGAALFFVDGAMIVGGIFEPYCDHILVVVAEQRLSLSRIILRDGISKIAALRRLDAQLPEERLRSAADYIIENNGGIDQLHRRADVVLAALLQTGEKH